MQLTLQVASPLISIVRRLHQEVPFAWFLGLIPFLLIGNTCSSSCCQETLSPFQPQDAAVISNTKRKQGKRYQAFSPTWYTSYPWLTLCTTRSKVFCMYCRYCSRKVLLGLAKKGEDSFIDTGFNNWKKAHERFSLHAQSGLHKEALFKVEQLKHDSVHTMLCK